MFRGAEAALPAGERLARRGPPVVRLALVGLARAPGLPSLAIAFVAVSVGLGGFALAYRATLIRGSADQAADRVPLDATVSPGPNFNAPLAVAPLARWQALARGTVAPVRRTEANYLRGSGTVTVPALGVPAGDARADPRLACERRLGAASRARAQAETGGTGPQPGPGAGRRGGVAGAASVVAGALGDSDRGPPRPRRRDPAATAGCRGRRAATAARPRASRPLGARGTRARRADRSRHHQRPSERRERRGRHAAASTPDAGSAADRARSRTAPARRRSWRLARSGGRVRVGRGGDRGDGCVPDERRSRHRPSRAAERHPAGSGAGRSPDQRSGDGRPAAGADRRRPAAPRAGRRDDSEVPDARRRCRWLDRRRRGDARSCARRPAPGPGPSRTNCGSRRPIPRRCGRRSPDRRSTS